jgi:hypothetical protein
MADAISLGQRAIDVAVRREPWLIARRAEAASKIYSGEGKRLFSLRTLPTK